MLTYTSTLRLKTGFFLVRPQKPYFANSPNTNHRLRYAPASLRKATSRPASDDEEYLYNSRGVRLIMVKWGTDLPKVKVKKALLLLSGLCMVIQRAFFRLRISKNSGQKVIDLTVP